MKIQLLALVLGLSGLGSAFGLFSAAGSDGINEHVSRHGNGQVKESTVFVDGARHGWTERWYADGTLRAKGRYEHGKMVGEWIWQLPGGQPDPARTGTYASGKRIAN